MLKPAVRRRGRRSDHAAPGRPPRPTSLLRRRSPRRSRHSRRASACFRRSVPHRPSWTWLRAVLHRLDDGAVARPAAGCAAAVPGSPSFVTIGSEVLINSKTGFDLPTLVLDEVQTLSAVCEERYRVSLPMRDAGAFLHKSKTFRERQRENGGRVDGVEVASRIARSIDALPPTPPTTLTQRPRAWKLEILLGPRRASTAKPCVT